MRTGETLTGSRELAERPAWQRVKHQVEVEMVLARAQTNEG
jgi:hypothetical protein